MVTLFLACYKPVVLVLDALDDNTEIIMLKIHQLSALTCGVESTSGGSDKTLTAVVQSNIAEYY